MVQPPHRLMLQQTNQNELNTAVGKLAQSTTTTTRLALSSSWQRAPPLLPAAPS